MVERDGESLYIQIDRSIVRSILAVHYFIFEQKILEKTPV